MMSADDFLDRVMEAWHPSMREAAARAGRELWLLHAHPGVVTRFRLQRCACNGQTCTGWVLCQEPAREYRA